MTEWISIAISILAIVISMLLEKEKLARLYSDIFTWQSQREQKKAGEQFVRKLRRAPENSKDGISTSAIFITLFLLLTIGSGLASLFQVKTFLEMSSAGNIALSFYLWLSIPGLIQEAEKLQLKWYIKAYTIIMLQLVCITLGVMWGFLVLMFISTGLPIFWAGMVGGIVLLVLVWLLLFIGARGTKNMQ